MEPENNKMMRKGTNELLTFYQKIEKQSRQKNLRQSLLSSAPILSSFMKSEGKKNIYGFILIYLKKLCDYIKADISDSTLSELSQDIYKEIYFLNLNEISCLFNYLKMQNYFTRSASEIIQNVQKYMDSRFEIAEQLSIDKHKAIMAGSMDDGFIEKFYAEKKANPNRQDPDEENRQNEAGFQKFKADYVRKVILDKADKEK